MITQVEATARYPTDLRLRRQMLKILRGIWRLIGLGVALQYLYFAVCMIGWRLGQMEWPHIDGVWMFLAVSGAFVVSMERLFPALRGITPC
jgi:hypothetical protein